VGYPMILYSKANAKLKKMKHSKLSKVTIL